MEGRPTDLPDPERRQKGPRKVKRAAELRGDRPFVLREGPDPGDWDERDLIRLPRVSGLALVSLMLAILFALRRSTVLTCSALSRAVSRSSGTHVGALPRHPCGRSGGTGSLRGCRHFLIPGATPVRRAARREGTKGNAG